MVTNVDYVFADISLSGTNIPDGTKLKDDALTGIYSAKVKLPAGKYKDITATFEGKSFVYPEFELPQEKEVTFYFDPSTQIYYNDASVNSQCSNYKNIYEQVINYFVGDIKLYNDNVLKYNEYQKSIQSSLLVNNYVTDKNYIDYNGDKKYEGKEN